MKALITGATGFIGHHLAWRLVNLGDEVTCLVRATSDLGDLQSLGVALRHGDVTEPATLAEAVRDADVVYHLAGLLRTAGHDEIWQVNEGGVANVADACARRQTPPALVVVSSIAAGGPSPDDRPLTEAEPAAPISDYGRSKLAGETAARLRAARVPTTIVRPPVVFGERDLETLELFRMADRGWHVVPGRRSQRLSLLHAADLAHLLQRVADAGERLPARAEDAPPGVGLYYAADERRPTFAELGQLIAGALGRGPLRLIPTPVAVTWGVAALSELAARVRRKPTLLSWETAREVTAGSWMCSSEKARAGLGFKLGVSLEERLRQTAQWYREVGWLM